MHLRAKFFGLHLLPAYADDREIRMQKFFAGEIVQGGKEFALCQIAGCTEYDHHARIGSLLNFGHLSNSATKHRQFTILFRRHS